MQTQLGHKKFSTRILSNFIYARLHKRLFIFLISVLKQNKEFTKAFIGFVCQKAIFMPLIIKHKATYITELKTIRRCYVADPSNLTEYDIFTETFRIILRTSLINLLLVTTGNRS